MRFQYGYGSFGKHHQGDNDSSLFPNQSAAYVEIMTEDLQDVDGRERVAVVSSFWFERFVCGALILIVAMLGLELHLLHSKMNEEHLVVLQGDGNGSGGTQSLLTMSNRHVHVAGAQQQEQNDVLQPSKRKRTTTQQSKNTTVLIVYGPGHDPWQQEMARFVMMGAMTVPNVHVQSKPVESASFQTDVLEADAIIVGAAVENANTHVAIQKWINEEWEIGARNKMEWKVGAAFVTAGGISAGQEGTLKNILQSLMIFGCIVVGGDSWKTAFGAAAITGEEPFVSSLDGSTHKAKWYDESCLVPNGMLIHPMFLDQARRLGTRVATVAKAMARE